MPHIVTVVMDIDQITLELAKYNQSQHSDEIYALTAYEKAGELTTAEFQTRVKSHLLKGLRSHSQLASLTQMHDRLIKHVLALLNSMDKHHEGVAVFVQFNAHRLEKEPVNKNGFTDEVVYSRAIPLYIEPNTHIYVGTIFDFTPFFRILRKTPLAVIAQVENNKAKVFSLTGTSLNDEAELENWHNAPTEKEASDVYRPGKQNVVHHGTGEENVARRQISANKVFLDEIAEPVSKLLQSSRWKNVLFYASENYRPYIENWSDDFKSFTIFPPHVVYKLFNDRESLRRDAENQLGEKNKDTIKQELFKLKEEYANFASGWKDVTDAVREFRVDTLYISLSMTDRRVGYILNNSLPFSYPVNEAKRVNDLLPWLTQGVIAAGGKVVAANELSDDDSVQIAAKLRYSG